MSFKLIKKVKSENLITTSNKINRKCININNILNKYCFTPFPI